MGQQSPELTKFYRDYLDWVDRGAPWDAPFDPSCGLCTNCSNHYEESVYEEMVQQFIDAGLHKTWPFGERAYEYYSDKDTMHLDERRIAWVRSHLS